MNINSDIDAAFKEVAELLDHGLKALNEHFPDELTETREGLVSVSNKLQALSQQRSKEQEALQKVKEKAKFWDYKKGNFDAGKELKAILDDDELTMEPSTPLVCNMTIPSEN